jgi:hypothetical protein
MSYLHPTYFLKYPLLAMHCFILSGLAIALPIRKPKVLPVAPEALAIVPSERGLDKKKIALLSIRTHLYLFDILKWRRLPYKNLMKHRKIIKEV